MKTLLVTAMLACSSFVFGCSGADAGSADPSPGATPAASDDAALSATASLSGTFQSVGTNDLKLAYNSYTFKSNGTYTAEGGCDGLDGHPATCGAITSASGTWKLATVNKQLKITLDDEIGNKDTFYFSHDTNTMTFNKTLSGSTAYFFDKSWKKHIGIGDVCQDDTGNSLGECQDSGNFACGQDGTNDNVYTCTPLD